MRNIKYIVLHTTATPQNTTPESILRYWSKTLGWKNPGYHYLIKADGTIISILPIEQVANGVAGFNSVSIHISYIGGIDSKGRPVDNRTDAQKQAQIKILKELRPRFPHAIIQGHRDFPGVQKACPSFDVREWLACVGIS